MKVTFCGSSFEVSDEVLPLIGSDHEIISRHWDVKEGDVCLDVGSGPGTWTLVALARGAWTMSFDPRALAARMLFDQIHRNGYTRGVVLPFGLWSSSGRRPFTEDLGSFNHGTRAQWAPVVALDEYLDGFPISRLDFINMDVEASELEVIRGAERTLRRFTPKLIIEVHEGVSIEDLERELASLSYDAFTTDSGFLVAERRAARRGRPSAPLPPVAHLYLTHDVIGAKSGGGAVTLNEYMAFSSMGGVTHPLDGLQLPNHVDPLEADRLVLRHLYRQDITNNPGRVHLYAGGFGETVAWLKGRGARVTYTAAAHDIEASRREFEELGLPYAFPHLTEPELWKRYVAGYLAADVVVCPSMLSKRVMESYGVKRATVIPHGCLLLPETPPLPGRFIVGYLGAGGPDKGLRHLFQAWKKLNLKDGLLLVAGNNVDQALPLWRKFGGGNVEFMGFVKEKADFFARISVYVQPSVSEGFGIEVLEAMAHARPVVVSTGAGAADAVVEGTGFKVPPRDPDAIAERLEFYRWKPDKAASDGAYGRQNAAAYDWARIREMYVSLWKSLDQEGS